MADDADEVAKIGVETATALGAALLAEDAPGLHIYAMNRSAAGQGDPRQPRPRLSGPATGRYERGEDAR